jgi:hypothetical protein
MNKYIYLFARFFVQKCADVTLLVPRSAANKEYNPRSSRVLIAALTLDCRNNNKRTVMVRLMEGGLFAEHAEITSKDHTELIVHDWSSQMILGEIHV